MIRSVLGSRASIGGVLGSGRGGAALWYLAGGVSAANCIAAYAPKGAASLAASYTNLANPGTYDAAPGVAPTFDTATGWTFASSSGQYLTTGIVPADGASMIVQCTCTADGAIVGHISGALAQWFAIRSIQFAPLRFRFYPGASVDWNTTNTSGVLAIAGGACFFDGSQVATSGGSGVSGSASTIHIGRYYGAELRYFNGSIYKLAIYDTTLSAATVAAISSAMSAL